MKIAYELGLHELGDGLYAYLQPDGGWGWSNAGLITAGGTSLLVDTLFDLKLTQDMLDAMASVTERSPIEQAFNTHGNGDHWFGNSLLPDRIPIIARPRPSMCCSTSSTWGRNSRPLPRGRCASSTSPR
jgi:glyoxylase-like metal-dependent hydrolase (beta-lactamase superfamily II)